MLYKTLFILTIVAAFAGMVFGSGGPTLPFNPNIPNFVNPFIPSLTAVGDWFVTSTNLVVGSATWTPNSTFGSSHGCSLANYWNCVNDPNGPDLNTSITRNYGRWKVTEAHALAFNFSIPVPYRFLTSLTFEMRCNTPNTEIPFAIDVIVFVGANQIALSGGYLKCPNPINTPFPPVLVPMKIVNGAVDLNATGMVNNQVYLLMSLSASGFDLGPNVDLIQNITYITAHATYANTATPSCNNPNDVFCAFGTALNFSINIIMFFVNGAVWFIVLLGNVVQMIANLFVLLLWLYTIPGVPVFIQIYIDAVLTTWLLIISVEIFKLIKPFA